MKLILIGEGLEPEVLTSKMLNEAKPGLVLFNSDETPIPDLVQDIYTAYRLYQESINNGTVKNFNIINHLDRKYIEENRKDVDLRKHLNFLLGVPIARSYGNGAVEKVANLLYNIKIFYDFNYTDDISINFAGYASSKEMEFDKEEEYKESRDMSLISGNIRSALQDLNPNIGFALYGDKFKNYDELDPLQIPRVLTAAHYGEKVNRITDTKITSEKKRQDRESEERMTFRASKSGDLKKVRPTEMAKGNIPLRFVKGELNFREGITSDYALQSFVVGIDYSGSMNNKVKQTRVKTIMASLLSKVLEGKAEISMSTYGYNILSTKTAKTKEEAIEMKDLIDHFKANQNGTDIGASIQTLIDNVIDMGMKEPQVIIILDGDDVIDPKTVRLRGVKISCFLLGRENKGMKELCEKSGGFVVFDNLYQKFNLL